MVEKRNSAGACESYQLRKSWLTKYKARAAYDVTSVARAVADARPEERRVAIPYRARIFAVTER